MLFSVTACGSKKANKPSSSPQTSTSQSQSQTSNNSGNANSNTNSGSSNTSTNSGSNNSSTTPEPTPGEVNGIIIGDVRVQLLSDSLVRIENKGPKGFEDRDSYIVTNRDCWYTVEYTQLSVGNETIISTEYYNVHVPNEGKAENAYVTDSTNERVLWTYQGLTDTNVYLPSPSDELKSWYFTDSPRIFPSDAGWVVDESQPMQGWDFDSNATDVYVFLPNGDYKTFTEDYTSLTGESELVQLKTLGYWDSRWYAYKTETALQQIEDYTSRGYSIDVLVIDTDWRQGSSGGTQGSGGIGYDINEELFPDMAAFLQQCEELGIDICFNDHPEPVDGTTNGLDSEEIEYRTNKLTMILSLGVDYWWYDRNWSVSLNSIDPDISVYAFGMYAYQFVTEAELEKQRKEGLQEYAERALIMANVDGCLHGKWNYASDISAHRYSIQWTGDIGAENVDLAQEIYASVFGGAEVGIPYMSSDIGGHNEAVTNEMYSRWIQYGALSTICRVHCTSAQYIGQDGRMPWLFGATAEEISHTYLDMRYRLLPLYYYLSYRNYDTGLPIMSRTDINYPDYVEAQANDQYLLGDYILVAPITSAGPIFKIPDEQLYHEEGGQKVAGLKAEYFTGYALGADGLNKTPIYTKVDNNIFFNWGYSAPSGIPSNDFSVRWTGKFKVGDNPATLSFFADDTVRVYIDGQEVVASDGFGTVANVGRTMYTTPAYEANSEHTIKVEFYEYADGSLIYMYYTEQTKTSVSLDTRNVFIPDGTWIDVWNGERFVGPQTYTVSHPLETSPIFVREGSLVTLAENMKNTGEKDWQNMALEVYPSKNYSASTILYEDDTKTVAYKDGKFRTTDIEMEYVPAKDAVVVTINPAEGTFDGDRAFTTRTWNVRIHTNPGWGDVTSVKVNNTAKQGTLYQKSQSANPFAFTGAALDSNVYEVKLENYDVYGKITIEICFENVTDTANNTDYDDTSVNFTMTTEEAGDSIDLTESGEIDWISYGEKNSATEIKTKNGNCNFNIPTSYDTAWVTYATGFTTKYGDQSYKTVNTSGISSQRNFHFEINTIGEEAYYVLYVGGNQSTAKVTVADRAGNKVTEYFGDITGSYKRKIVIHVTDTTQSTLYVTFAMHASEPNDLYTFSYVTVMAGLISKTLPSTQYAGNVSVTASADVVAIDGQTINLSNLDSQYDTLYWEHYQREQLAGEQHPRTVIEKMAGADDIIINSADSITTGFGDYKANINWSNGATNLIATNNTNGLQLPNTEYTVNVTISPNVKKIMIFTGSYQSSGIARMYNAKGELIATSTSFDAGEVGIARQIVFNVNASDTTTVTIKITPTVKVDWGNVTMVAVGVVGEQTVKPVSVTATTQVNDITGSSFNLTNLSNGYDTLYWEKYQTGGTVKMVNTKDIITNNIETINTFGFSDYKASVSWYNGNTTNTLSQEGNTSGLCNCGATYEINIKVDENTKQIQIFTGSWEATGTAEVYDASGNKITTSESWSASADGIARLLTVNIDVAEATEITIKLIQSVNPNTSGNVSLVGIGVLGYRI